MTKTNSKKSAPVSSSRAKTLTPKDRVFAQQAAEAGQESSKTRELRIARDRAYRTLRDAAEAAAAAPKSKAKAEAERVAGVAHERAKAAYKAHVTSATSEQRAEQRVTALAVRPATLPQVLRQAPAQHVVRTPAATPARSSISAQQFIATLEVQIAAALARATPNQERIDTLRTTLALAKLLG